MESNLQILESLSEAFLSKKPFVVYTLPNSDVVKGVFQNDEELYLLHDLTVKGIVLCSFDSSQKVIIPFDKSTVLEEKWNFKNNQTKIPKTISYTEDEKQNFEKMVYLAVETIKTTDIDKIVLSRKQELKNAFQTQLPDLVKRLFSMYNNTFNYCFYHPKVGIWIGATPEKLLSVKDNILQTMSYAGTQKFENTIEVTWGKKEKEEQAFVTQFIVDSLQKYGANIKCSVPYTSVAGRLLHIRTDIEMNVRNLEDLRDIITDLHPTPAVCGLPKQKAMDKIKELEQYNREFYAGYIGELNVNNQTNLFVNIRCATLKGSDATLYVGCGITEQSVPEDEFQETVNKSSTMSAIFF